MSKKYRGVFLFTPTLPNYHKRKIQILKDLLKNSSKFGIYLTLSNPHHHIEKELKKHKVNTSRIYFIDGIGKKSKEEGVSDNCSYISGPDSLVELSILLNNAFNTGHFEFLLIDSMNIFPMYNDLKTVEKFSHYLISRIRDLKIDGAILAIEQKGESEEMLCHLKNYVDSIITS